MIFDKFENKTVLVSGGAGFVGKNIIIALLKNVINIKIYNFDKSKYHQNDSRIIYVEGDLRTKNYINTVNNIKFDFIFHQAALVDTTIADKTLMYETNVYSFDALIRKAIVDKSVLVYASSAAVYGNSTPPNTVAKNETPTNVYGESKLLMDKKALQYMNENKELKIIGLRYFNVYGQGEEEKGNMASMIRQLFLQMKENKKS